MLAKNSGNTLRAWRAQWTLVRAGMRRNQIVHVAAGLAFFALISLIPLALLVVSVAGHSLGRSDVLFAQLVEWIAQILPGAEGNVTTVLRQLIDRRLTMGITGFIFLIFSSSLFFTGLERAIDRVLQSVRPRRLLRSHVQALWVMFCMVALFALPVLVNFIAGFLLPKSALAWVPRIFSGAPFFIGGQLVSFIVLLRVMPRDPPTWRAIARGALIFGIASLLMRGIFHAYLQVAWDRYHFVYGSLAGFFVLCVWIYYMSLLLLFCVEWVAVVDYVSDADTELSADARQRILRFAPFEDLPKERPPV